MPEAWKYDDDDDEKEEDDDNDKSDVNEYFLKAWW